jgi:DNA-binding winged helix-turn-helix (wHTH) protein
VRVRLTRLRRDAREYGRRPVVSDDGRLCYGESWVALSPRREPVAAVLVGHFGELARVDDLLDRDPGSRSDASVDHLRGIVLGLRRALRPLGLEIDTIPAVGYTLRAVRRRTA